MSRLSAGFHELAPNVRAHVFDAPAPGPTALIQAITVTARTGALKISEGPKSLEVFFHEGQIWSLTGSHAEPEEGFYDFLTWTTGQFGFQPADQPEGERSFFKDTTSLLLEGMRRLDDIQSGRLPVQKA